MLKLIMTVLQWAICIGVAGGLIDATRVMRNKAVSAHQLGLVSLSRLNHVLVSGGKHSKIDRSHVRRNDYKNTR